MKKTYHLCLSGKHEILFRSNQNALILISLFVHVQSCAHLCQNRMSRGVHEGLLVPIHQILQCKIRKTRPSRRKRFLSNGDQGSIPPAHMYCIHSQESHASWHNRNSVRLSIHIDPSTLSQGFRLGR